MDTQSLNPYFFANSNPNPNKMGADSLAEKIPQMSQNLSAQFVCPSPKVLDVNEKRLHWVSVVRERGFLVGLLFKSCLNVD